MKKCRECGFEKPLDNFYKQESCALGVTTKCKECTSLYRSKKYAENPDKAKNRSKEWRGRNPDRVIEYLRAESLKWETKKKEKVERRNGKTARQIWKEQNVDKIRTYLSASQKKIRSTVKGKLNSNVRAAIHRGIKKGGKNGLKTYDILGFTADELVSHLESLWMDGMNWSNYGIGEGNWVIDHKIPLAAHSYETVEDDGFKSAWSLSNLQPMWFIDNCSKGKRISQEYGNVPHYASDN